MYTSILWGICSVLGLLNVFYSFVLFDQITKYPIRDEYSYDIVIVQLDKNGMAFALLIQAAINVISLYTAVKLLRISKPAVQQMDMIQLVPTDPNNS